MRILSVLLLAAAVIVQSAAAQTPVKTLQIYYVDTEGGQATLFVTPSGESLLVDVGNPGGRDTDRIMLALEDAGVKQIDHLVLTHYHGDHVGGLAELAKRISIKKFYDHGPAAEGDRAGGQGFMEQYAQIHASAVRTIVKPGDKLSIPGLDITVVSSAGQTLKSNLPGAGRPNPACAGFAEKDLSKVFDPDNCVFGGLRAGLRPIPHDRSRRPDVESRGAVDVSSQPAWNGGSLISRRITASINRTPRRSCMVCSRAWPS